MRSSLQVIFVESNGLVAPMLNFRDHTLPKGPET